MRRSDRSATSDRARPRGLASRMVFAAVLAATAALLATACGGGSSGAAGEDSLPGTGKPAVTLGTKDFPEEFILGELYKQALEAQGYTVNLKKNIGPTEVTDRALQSGEIDGYPEYMGSAVSVVAGDDRVPKTAAETYRIAKRFYAGRGQTLSEQTPYFNVDAIGTTAAFAKKNNLKSVADLKNIGSFTLGARPEFKDRFNGLRGMRQVYGITNAKFVQLPQGITYQALDDNSVDTINVFSTDAQLASGKYAVLDDPKGVFGYQHVALVIDEDKLAALGGDEFMGIINDVNAVLTTDAIIGLNEAVVVRKQAEDGVAHDFLEQHGLLGS